MTSNNTGVATLDLNQLPSSSVGSLEIFDDIAKGPDFLGRLQLFSKGKNDSKGKQLIAAGNYGIPVSEDEVIDLGDTIEILPLSRRAKAIDMNDRPVVCIYDETNPEFDRIRKQSEIKDSGCQFGPSFLVIERKTRRFLEYFLGAPTHRPEAKKIYPAIPINDAEIARRKDLKIEGAEDLVAHGPLPLTLKSKFIKSRDGKHSWFVPVVLESSTPFTTLPRQEVINKEMIKFNEAKTELEAAPADEKKTGRKR